MQNKKRVFISYGRKESRDFANRLYLALEKINIDAWFDFVNIPKGDDFQKRIEDGIESADNFVFLIAPHAIQSEYCLHEIETAIKFNKRIIPIMHIEPAQGDAAWDKIHPAISKLNWINFREKADLTLAIEEWEDIDDFEAAFEELIQVFKRDEEYISQHTSILLSALIWDRKRRMPNYLLAGPELFAATEWLAKEFPPPLQAPCVPTNLQCEFICESIKNANNLMADVFMISSSWDDPWREFLRMILARNLFTSWRYSSDLQAGLEEKDVIREGIEGADMVFFLVSEQSINSGRCLDELEIAAFYNKKVIPVIVQELPANSDLPEKLKNLSSINFTQIKDITQADPMLMQHAPEVNTLIGEIDTEKGYFHKHKLFLTRALKWSRMDKNDSFLMRGYNLSEAQTWLQEGLTRSKYRPTDLHQEFLEASALKVGTLESEVFICYSQKNADFARKLNLKLQTFGKNTWFDQESLIGASNFEEEIFRGIAVSENFVFIITPESIASEFCAKEVDFAAAQNKRFIPILLEETSPENIPQQLKRIQWVDFKHKTFETAFGRLIQAINIDRAYVQKHTRLQQLALEWQHKGNSNDLLVRGDEFTSSQQWLDESLQNKKEPAVTVLQRSFIEASEKVKIQEEKKALNHRNWRRAARISLIILLASGVFFLAYQSRQSMLKEEEAREKAALNYAYAARQILNENHAPKRALSIAKEAVRLINQNSIYKLIPYFRDIFTSLNFVDLPHSSGVLGVDFSPNYSNRVILSYSEKNLKIWDLEGKLIKTIPIASNIVKAGFSPDQQRLYVLNGQNKLLLISDFLTDELQTTTLQTGDEITDVIFKDEGKEIIIIYKEIAARLWNANGGYIRPFNHKGQVTGGILSQNQEFLLTFSNDKTARLWNANKIIEPKYLTWHDAPIIDADISEDGTRGVTLDNKGYAAIWDLQENRIVKSYEDIANIKLTAEEDLIVLKDKNKKVRLEDISGQFFTELMTYKQFNSGIDTLILTEKKDGILTYSKNGSAAFWKLNGVLSTEIDLMEDNEKVDEMVVSPDANYILKSDSKGTVTIWDIESGSRIASLKAHKSAIKEVVFLPDRRQLLTASLDNLAKKWIFRDTTLDNVLSTAKAKPVEIKQNIENWLASVKADTLKMAAVDKIRIGLLDDFDTIMAINDSSELYTYAEHFKTDAENTFDSTIKAESYRKAFKLYEKINDTLAYRTIYSEVAVADILFETGREVEFEDFFHPDNLQENLFLAQYISQKWSKRKPTERIEAFTVIKNVYDDVLQNIKNNTYQVSAERETLIKRRAADNCNSLSYYELLGGDVAKARTLAEEGFNIDSTYEWINTKLALAYLYDGDFDKALVLLKKMKGEHFGVDNYYSKMKDYIATVDSTHLAQKTSEDIEAFTLENVLKSYKNKITPEQQQEIQTLLTE
ncbi:toll/interleukin-1 receptor domain-containing protein [Chondrinema litorale]|uniref:toll/interleukin-1 receptor domain-containing protein n=1 Tax=Chondrinema litorale TaxID=2994555 RepID=UPI002543A6A4|nr:TIR domain-containing protein [Chondrinema litorale]UZR95024.1 TIR domain-containing protein [Chondrinema litorale]